jgi:hypothetical protein
MREEFDWFLINNDENITYVDVNNNKVIEYETFLNFRKMKVRQRRNNFSFS